MKNKCLILLLSVFLFNSCIGLKVDIQMNRDGSGRLTMEYRLSRALESIGTLDGNEKWPPVPVGRQDWERAISRINGTRLASFSSAQKGQDTITTVVLNFDNAEALLFILDPQGKNSRFTANGRHGEFQYILNDAALGEMPVYDANLIELAKTMFAGYDFSISLRASENSTLTLTDAKGSAITPPQNARVITSGRKVSMVMEIMDLIDMPNGIGVKINW